MSWRSGLMMPRHRVILMDDFPGAADRFLYRVCAWTGAPANSFGLQETAAIIHPCSAVHFQRTGFSDPGHQMACRVLPSGFRCRAC
jgi:hypothetical protein